MQTIKKNAVKARQRATKPILTDKAVCTFCGAEIADNEPTVCCARGVVAYLDCVVATLQRSITELGQLCRTLPALGSSNPRTFPRPVYGENS